MCGIAGFYNYSHPRGAIYRMVEEMKSRGPDDMGIYEDVASKAALGHTRLAIIDLSAAGHQPMSYYNGRFWIVFNGEIYNYRELGNELRSRGHVFQSETDTEVIVASYAEWGCDAIKRLRGMFALAIYDRFPMEGPPLLLARDHFGVKPLLYCATGGGIAFASELRAIIASGVVPKRIDEEALLDFFAVGAVFQPRTIFQDVKALPPGTWMEVREDRYRIIEYWNVHSATTALRSELRDISFSEAVSETRHLLREAARLSMVADVPVGAFLSGGIDSTGAVALMKEVSGKKVETFSVGFEDCDVNLDERSYAAVAAAYLGAEHHEIIVTAADALKFFPRVVDCIDQPSFDGTNVWLVSEAARSSVKVAISGIGADEIFGGYAHFRSIATASKVCPAGSARIFAMLDRIHALRPNRFTLKALFCFASPAMRFSMLRRLLSDRALEKALTSRVGYHVSRRVLQRQENLLVKQADGIQQTSYAELRGYLASTLLRDSDVMSMAHGLELRPLFLDKALVEFVYAIPEIHKTRPGSNKPLLVSALGPMLPESVRNRRKMGFELPLGAWMCGPLKDTIMELLNGVIAAKLFRPSYLKRIQRGLATGSPPHETWGWAVLLGWLRKQKLDDFS